MSPTETDLRRRPGATTHHAREAHELWLRWQEHHPRLRRVVARRAGRPVSDHTVHDAATDALLELARVTETGDVVRDPSAWLSTVAWREFLRLCGREARRRQLEEVDFVRDTRLRDAPGPEETAMRRADLQAKRRVLDRALRTLTPGQRQSIELLAAGATYDEIAVARSSTYRAVDRALRRSRVKLRQYGPLVREARGDAA